MDTLRFVLVLSLAMVSFMLWEAWQRDYGPPARAAARPGDGAPATPPTTDSGVPALPSNPGGQAPGFDAPSPAETEQELITVETDVLRLKIDSGGTLVFAELLNYPVSLEEGAKPIVLLDQSTSLFHVIQSGLIGTDAPSHEHQFSSPRKAYSLGENESVLKVPLRWVSEQGVVVSKVFELERGSYRIRLRHQMENRSGANWEGRQYAQIKRDDPSRAGRMLLYTYTGAVLSGPEKRYDKISFDDMRDGPVKADIANGWAAMIQHYFLTAVIPSDQQATYHYYTQDFANGLYSIGHISPALRLAPGGQDELVGEVYVGPKLQADLAQLAEGLDLTVDYGWLWFLAKPLFWCLERLHGLTGNWGWSIILVTILLKLLFYHLSAAGYRSMANMRRVQPRLMALRDRYKDDRARMNQAMMQIYKEEKINPFGGLLSHPGSDPGVHRLVLGAVGKRRTEAGGFHPVAKRSIRQRSLLCLAGDHGRHHVHSAKTQPCAHGPLAGKSVQVVAPDLHGVFRLFPLRAGAVLGDEQHPVHCPAMADHEKSGKRRTRRRQGQIAARRQHGAC